MLFPQRLKADLIFQSCRDDWFGVSHFLTKEWAGVEVKNGDTTSILQVIIWFQGTHTLGPLCHLLLQSVCHSYMQMVPWMNYICGAIEFSPPWYRNSFKYSPIPFDFGWQMEISQSS